MTKIGLFDVVSSENIEEKYSKKAEIPQYTPSGEMPSIFSLVNRKKYDELMQEIAVADISDTEKEFLRLAATRHIVFDYEKIADYYANSPKVMQELMEHSALVIIDLNDAIAQGYAKLDKRLVQYAEESYSKIHGEVNG